MGFPSDRVVKNPPCHCRRHRFHPWVGRFPWGSKRQPAPVFLPGKFHGHKSLVGYSPWGHKESEMTKHYQHVQIKSAGIFTNITSTRLDSHYPAAPCGSCWLFLWSPCGPGTRSEWREWPRCRCRWMWVGWWPWRLRAISEAVRCFCPPGFWVESCTDFWTEFHLK